MVGYFVPFGPSGSVQLCHRVTRVTKTLIECKVSPLSPRLLNLSLTSDLVPEQDVIDVIIHVGRNPQGRTLAWRYFREKWDILNAR